MAFRRRRKPTVSWLPNLGQGPSSLNLDLTGSVTVSATPFTISTSLHAVVPDYPAEAIRAAAGGGIPTISDFEGSGYRLRRIVGKFYCAADQIIGGAQDTRPTTALVGAGLIILRVRESDGAPLRAATPNDYSPLGLDNVRDPWIWRRTWLLSNEFGGGGQTPTLGLAYFPFTNVEYGSAWDGPHIDQKTARRVSAEERLFLVVSAVNPANAADADGGVRYVYEARYLTSPLKVMGNRRNASR